MSHSSGSRLNFPFVVSALSIALALAVLAGTITLARGKLRGRIRDQIADQTGAVLNAVMKLRLNEDVLDVFTELVEVSTLEGVIGLQHFDSSGRLVDYMPAWLNETETLRQEDLTVLSEGEPVVRFNSDARMSNYFMDIAGDANDDSVPILETFIPLKIEGSSEPMTFAQFIIEGETLQDQFNVLDQNLKLQGRIAILGSSLVLIAIMGSAYWTQYRSNALLSQRTQDLLQANHELSMAAKTSAVGSVSAHLIHGLKNPLAGLQSFVSAKAKGKTVEDDSGWIHAAEAAQRMQRQIADVVRVLQEEQSSVSYNLELSEIMEILSQKSRSIAEAKGVEWTGAASASAVLRNRDANLVILILENLIRNAVDACQHGDSVSLEIKSKDSEVICSLKDTGGGIPGIVQRRLFTPIESAKEGGGGIGLAISKQLSGHLGASLELVSTSNMGTQFDLRLPQELFVS